jgi:hypothetical protein
VPAPRSKRTLAAGQRRRSSQRAAIAKASHELDREQGMSVALAAVRLGLSVEQVKRGLADHG